MKLYNIFFYKFSRVLNKRKIWPTDIVVKEQIDSEFGKDHSIDLSKPFHSKVTDKRDVGKKKK